VQRLPTTAERIAPRYRFFKAALWAISEFGGKWVVRPKRLDVEEPYQA